jgi:hypothetical protein
MYCDLFAHFMYSKTQYPHYSQHVRLPSHKVFKQNSGTPAETLKYRLGDLHNALRSGAMFRAHREWFKFHPFLSLAPRVVENAKIAPYIGFLVAFFSRAIHIY